MKPGHCCETRTLLFQTKYPGAEIEWNNFCLVSCGQPRWETGVLYGMEIRASNCGLGARIAKEGNDPRKHPATTRTCSGGQVSVRAMHPYDLTLDYLF